MLEQVQGKVKSYENDHNQKVALIHGLVLRNTGDIERMHGELMKSLSFFKQALKAIESSPDNIDRTREAARTRGRLGEALVSQGIVREALEHYTAAVKAWEQVAASEAVKVDDCTSFADSLVSTAELKNRMGKASLAIKDLDKAANIITTVPLSRCGPVARHCYQRYILIMASAIKARNAASVFS